MTVKEPDDPPFGRNPTGGMEASDQWHKLLSGPDLSAARLKASKEGAAAGESAKDKRGGVASGVARREKPSPNPIKEFITNKLKRTPDISGRDMVAALKVDAETGVSGNIEMSDDGKAFVVYDDAGKEKRRLKATSVAATISRIRKKIWKKS